MSADRYRSEPPFLRKHLSAWRGTGGGRACKMCGNEVPKGRKGWCSRNCVLAWKEVSTSSGLRAAVAHRDGAVCARCGTDCARLKRMCESALERLGEWAAGAFVAVMERSGWRGCFRKDVVVEDGLARKRWKVLAMWQADHVIAVADGGGGTGRENAVPKCVPCHRARTAAQAAERGRKDRLAERRAFREEVKDRRRKRWTG